MDDYYSALNLYQQWESFYEESLGHKEKANSDVRMLDNLDSDGRVTMPTINKEVAPFLLSFTNLNN